MQSSLLLSNLMNTITFNNYRKVIFLLLFACSFLLQAHSQSVPPPKQWDKTIGGPLDDFLHAMVATPDGGYLLGGYYFQGGEGGTTEPITGTYDYYIVKIDKNGKKEWDKTYGGDNYDFLYSIANTADSGYLLGGYSLSGKSGDKSTESKGGYDYWIVKIDKNGNKEWDKSYGGADYDLLYNLVATPDGGFLLGGSSSSAIGGDKSEGSRGSGDYWIVKVDKSGTKQWDKTFGGSDFDNFKSLINTPGGGFLLGGYTQSGISGDKSDSSRGFYDYWVVKIDKNGNKIWDKTLGGNNLDELTSMIVTSDTGYLIGGDSYSHAGADKTDSQRGFNDYWIIKLDANGNKKWDKTFGGTGSDYFSAIATDNQGYYLGGSSSSGKSGDKSEESKGEFDYWIVKIDEAGKKLWDIGYGGGKSDNLSTIVTTADKGYLLGGQSKSGIGGDKSEPALGGADFWLIKSGTDTVKIPSVTLTTDDNILKYTGPGRIKLHADVANFSDTIARVQFYNGTTLLHTELYYPYGFLWTNVPIGVYTLYAKAIDIKGNVVTSDSVIVSVVAENVPPIVSIVSPLSDTMYNGPATIELIAKAKDPNDKISKVEFYNGDTLLTTEYIYPYTYSWMNVQPGTYRITAKATDDKGLSSISTPRMITVTSTAIVSTRPIFTGNKRATMSLKLFPNPASKSLQIFTNGLPRNKVSSMSVISVAGVVIQTINSITANQVIQLDVSKLTSGIYNIKIISGNNVTWKQFVKL
ncbi:Ig-like domain-containing protein [Segetibacter koreensis]|uniref:T9SS type A sorting domain-containing protein n=1 Tax=Segetibacter koreensis TaxID=398037 RepID=UPI00039AB2B1|nr:Ig-like domain-containing protein [Segetibacter koreensis]